MSIPSARRKGPARNARRQQARGFLGQPVALAQKVSWLLAMGAGPPKLGGTARPMISRTQATTGINRGLDGGPAFRSMALRMFYKTRINEKAMPHQSAAVRTREGDQAGRHPGGPTLLAKLDR
jgi:hypothetical protein